MIRLLVADDSPEIVRAVRERLEKHPGWHVCGQASNGLEAVSQTSDLNPDVVILDLTMPKLNGFQTGLAIHTAAPKLPLLLFTQQFGTEIEQEARSSGISGCVNKSYELLIAGFESLLRGETFFEPSQISRLDSGCAGRPTEVAEPATTEDSSSRAGLFKT
jgi:DNA-binding NarL/FixJ family response regulator